MKKILFLLALLFSAAVTLSAAELLTNRTFTRNFNGWIRRGAKNSTITWDNNAAVFNGTGKTFLIFNKLPVKPGNYQAEYTISGSGKYRVYCELFGRIDGKRYYRSSGAAIMDVPEKSEKRSFKFTIRPDEVAKVQSFSFVICFENGKNIRISDPSLKLTQNSDSPAAPAAVNAPLGGKWQLAANASLAANGMQLEQRGGKQLSKLVAIPVSGGKSYRFSCHAYGAATTDATGSCGFRLTAFADGKELIIPQWDDTWQGEKAQIKYLNFTIPAGKQKLDLYFEVRHDSVMRFSDLKLVEVAPQEPQSSFIMLSPCYRDTVFSSVPLKELSGKADFRGKAARAEAVMEVDGKKISAAVKADGTFTFANPGKQCRITVTFFNAEGKKISDAVKTIRFPEKHHNEVTFDKDNFMLINGKRFFPVIFWEFTAVNEPDGLYFAAKNGANCFILTSRYVKNNEQKLQILDRAHKYGIKVFLQVPSIDNLTDDKKEEFTRKFQEMNPENLRNHPAVIGYFITDEPIWRGIPQNRVSNGYEIISTIDPYHPIWLNAAPRNPVGVHAGYAQAADIYGIDIYPYPYPSTHSGMEDKGLTCVGKYTEFCRQAVYGRKPVWMALQGYSWHSYRNPDDGRGYPGLNQMRFMWYDTLLNGGRAASIWGTRHIRSEAFYDILFDLTREMHLVSGLFTKYEKSEKISSQNQHITAELLSVGKEKYLIVRNTGDIPHMSLLKGDFPKMSQLYPANNRILEAKRHQVSLEPFEVVIFGTAALPEPNYQLPASNKEFDKMRNPFKRVTKMDIGKMRYSGQANWIWDKNMIKPFARISAQRKFTIAPDKVKDITLLIAVDDGGICRFNGKEVAKLETSYADMQMVKIPKALWKAENIIDVDAYDSGMVPCGILCEIRITGTDGKVQVIVTDKQWSCNGNAAHIIAKFGSGAWGRRVSYQVD